ncbi:MAG: hypothetical protein AAGC77_06520 [Pseudomonadota bacterium]
MTTSFIALAQETIAALAADTDAETSLTFTQQTYTRANPWEKGTADTPATDTATGFVLPPGTSRVDGQLVHADERVIYVAAADLTSVTLGADTTVTFDGKTFATEKFNRYPEGDNPALYEIFVGLG